jgi:hypothetical protein
MDSSICLLVTTWFGFGRVDGPRPRPAGAAQLPLREESTQHNILEATGSAINFIACVRAVLTKISALIMYCWRRMPISSKRLLPFPADDPDFIGIRMQPPACQLPAHGTKHQRENWPS